jgi:signal transduction histidine kinase
MKLVRRLTLYLLVVIGTVVGVDTWLGVRAHLKLFEEDARRDERVLGRAFATAVEAEWRARGEGSASALIEEASRREDGVEIRLVRLDLPPGDPLAPEASASALEAWADDRALLQLRHEGEHGARLLTYVALATPLDERPFALEISETLSHERTYPLARVRRTLAAAALTLLACGAIAWGVGVRLVGRPVSRLVAKARRIGSGDFSEPLLLPGCDEFSLLAVEMNAMAGQLDAAARRVSVESAQRIAALEQLRHADRLTTVGKLASGLAHELGTPLNVVSGRAKMIASGEATGPDEVVSCARIVCQQAERMTGIVRQLLDFARRRSPEKSPTDVAQLARQTASLLEPLAGRRGVHLLCADAGAPLVAALDASQVQQALTNLVVNAIQATKAAGTVRLRALRQDVDSRAQAPRPAGGYAVLEVSDDGEGIPAERLGVIFDPFFTTKGIGEGTGLGLSVAHGIVQEHGGWIEVESAPGRGSCFRIWLPAAPA